MFKKPDINPAEVGLLLLLLFQATVGHMGIEFILADIAFLAFLDNCKKECKNRQQGVKNDG
jgi:hypothetical protein